MDNVQDIKTSGLHCQEHSEMNLDIFTFIRHSLFFVTCDFYTRAIYTCNILCHKSLSGRFDEGCCWTLGWLFAAGNLQRQKARGFSLHARTLSK
jgi:hypothetical protein